MEWKLSRWLASLASFSLGERSRVVHEYGRSAAQEANCHPFRSMTLVLLDALSRQLGTVHIECLIYDHTDY